MPVRTFIGVLTCLTATAGWAGERSRAAVPPQTPWFDGLGRYTRKVTTTQDGAQGYFDQGLAFLVAANREEALRSFQEAARYDPHCAMAYWGIAMALGRQLEQPAPDQTRQTAAVAAINRAHELAIEQATAEERALIDALAERHRDPPPVDARELDRAYAQSLAKAAREFPADYDIQALALVAEVLAIQRDDGSWEIPGAAWQSKLFEGVDNILDGNPQHPWANVLNILVAQRSGRVERAERSADVLRRCAPGLGYLLALPARLDVQQGKWAQAYEALQSAAEADQRYLQLAQRATGDYAAVMAEQRVLTTYVACMLGRSAEALAHARSALALFPAEASPRAELAEAVHTLPIQVMVRFGWWDQLLQEPEPPAEYPGARAFRLTARALALAAKGDVPAAREELSAVVDLESKLSHPLKPSLTAMLATLAPLVSSEILLRDGELEAAIASNLQAAQAEEAAAASWPQRRWLLAAYDALGTVLLRAHRAEEARAAFARSLELAPQNGWSLLGLLLVARQEERTEDAADLQRQLSAAWNSADVTIASPWAATPALLPVEQLARY